MCIFFTSTSSLSLVLRPFVSSLLLIKIFLKEKFSIKSLRFFLVFHVKDNRHIAQECAIKRIVWIGNHKKKRFNYGFKKKKKILWCFSEKKNEQKCDFYDAIKTFRQKLRHYTKKKILLLYFFCVKSIKSVVLLLKKNHVIQIYV